MGFFYSVPETSKGEQGEAKQCFVSIAFSTVGSNDYKLAKFISVRMFIELKFGYERGSLQIPSSEIN